MASVDVPVALLGYGTVGAAVNRLLTESADDIERATGHRLRVVKALVRDLGKERDYPPAAGCSRPTSREIADDPSIAVVAEVMGGVEPAGGYVLELLRARQARRHREQAARRPARRRSSSRRRPAAGVQLRFEASVCAAIPVIKVLRESLVVTNVHRVLGIVNGTTNFVLTEMEGGKSYDEALAEAQAARLRRGRPDRRRLRRRRRREDGDPRHRRVQLARRRSATSTYVGHRRDRPARRRRRARARHGDPARRRRAPRRRARRRARRSPRSSTSSHPLAKVDGAFNAVMLQGDAIREITLEGPGAGGIETASAVIADMASVIGTMGTGFLQNDAAWRELPRLPRRRQHARRSTSASRSRTAPACSRASPRRSREREISIARLLQHQNGDGAALHVVTHEARGGRARRRARRRSRRCDEVHAALAPAARRLRPRRRGARMGVTARDAATPASSLGEGSTPLVPAPRLSEALGLELHLKCEGLNPTGSFKDRGMAVAVERAVEAGAARSSAPRPGTPPRRPPRTRRAPGSQAVVLTPGRRDRDGEARAGARRGARVLEVRGSFDDALRLCRELGERGRLRARQLAQPGPDRGPEDGRRSRSSSSSARRPTCIALPYGGGGNVSARREGLRRGRRVGRGSSSGRRPSARRRSASAIRIGEPAHARDVAALVARGRVDGRDALRGGDARPRGSALAREEGVFCEPASAAGRRRARAARARRRGSTVVCILTGHG